jgi:hypothetical protein
MIISRKKMLMSGIFFIYVLSLIMKNILNFSDGIQDLMVIGFILTFLLFSPVRLINGMGVLVREKITLIFICFFIYFIWLSIGSRISILDIALEFLSIFKWLIYFYLGFLSSYVLRLKGRQFNLPDTKLMLIWALSLLLYSLLFFNWSTLLNSELNSLFGFYENSYSSLFSQRSVFGLFGFILFLYALNNKNYSNKNLLILTSVIFIFMSGNRKILIAVLMIILFFDWVKFFNISESYRKFINLFTILLLLVIAITVSSTSFFKKSVTEYSNLEQPRVAAYLISYEILKDNFPIGSGPATFASRGSMIEYSSLYSEYDLDNRWGFRQEDEVKFHNDTYWAQIISQYGAIGLLLFFFLSFSFYRLIDSIELLVSPKLIFTVFLLISIVTPSLQRIEVALFVFFVFGVLTELQNKKQTLNIK